MATQLNSVRFVHRTTRDRLLPDAVWWPWSRFLQEQLPDLVSIWPATAGRIHVVQYSPPDWDDRPRRLEVGDRTVAIGSFPGDNTHLLTVTLASGERSTVRVIPPQTPRVDAEALLRAVAADNSD
jgi:hypothetical protein